MPSCSRTTGLPKERPSASCASPTPRAPPAETPHRAAPPDSSWTRCTVSKPHALRTEKCPVHLRPGIFASSELGSGELGLLRLGRRGGDLFGPVHALLQRTSDGEEDHAGHGGGHG